MNGFSKNKRDNWYQVLSKYFDLELIGVSWDEAIRGINLRPQQKQNFYSDFERAINAIRNSQFFKDDFSSVITITSAKPFLKSISNLSDSTIFFKWLKRRQLHKIHIEKLTPNKKLSVIFTSMATLMILTGISMLIGAYFVMSTIAL